MKRDKNELGQSFENWLSDEFQMPRVIGSGNSIWHKLDIKGKELILSAKSTQNKSYSLKRSDLEEIRNSLYGPGGLGLSHTGMLLLGFYPEGEQITAPDEVYAIISLDSLLHLLESNRGIGEAKSTTKRQTAQTPSLMRKRERRKS